MASITADDSRHLAAIVFLDMVGYSALMQQSELRAEGSVQTLWGIARPILAQHGGREVRLFGDGMLMEFSATLSAVRACLDVLAKLHEHNRPLPAAERIRTRAGVHLGDIGHRDDQIFGDGVNIAARLVALAPPGSVVVSPHVRDQIVNALEHSIKSLGVKALKNIRSPLEVFCLAGPECAAADVAAAAAAGEVLARRWYFSTAVLDEGSAELTVDGNSSGLDREHLDVLLHLLQRAGEIVSREELLEACRLSMPEALDQYLFAIRQTLRDRDQTLIKTEAGFGYRLVAPVKVEASAARLTQYDFRAGEHLPARPLWSLVRCLGKGGQGEVWLAQHDKTKEERVYKFALEPAHLVSLKREITLSRLLQGTASKDCFMRVLDWNLEQAPYFIECEYSSSGSLVTWAEALGGLLKLALADRLELAALVAEALAAAHSVGVLHKDLKPANVLVGQRKGQPATIKLADFGTATVLDPDSLDQFGITRMGFTKTLFGSGDSTTGTVMYFAPELLLGQTATVQADIYALGVMLYQFVIGDFRRPMASGWEQEIEDELLREDIAEAAHGNPSKRLSDASVLAQRLRTLEQRRIQREQERLAQEHARLALDEAQRARQKLEDLREQQILLTAAYDEARRARDEALTAAATTKAVSDFLTQDLLAAGSEEKGPAKDMTVRDLLDKAAATLDQRFKDQPAVAAQAHDTLSKSYNGLRSRDQAIEHLQAAVLLYEKHYGRTAELTLDALTRLADLLQFGNRSDAAHTIVQELLGHRQKQLGELHPTVLDLRRQIALYRFHLGDLEISAAQGRALLQDIARAEMDAKGRLQLTLNVTFVLGMACSMSDFDEAEQHCRRFFELRAQIDGEHHVQTAIARLQVGIMLTYRGFYEDAEREVQCALDDMRAWWGAEHPGLAQAISALGVVRLRQNRFEEAVSLLEDGQKRFAAQGPSMQKWAAWFAQWLAEAYLGAQRNADAVKVMQDAVTFYANAPEGPDSRFALVPRVMLAIALGESGEIAEAWEALKGNRPGLLARLPEKNFILGYHRRAEGLLWLKTQHYDQARAALSEALEIYELRFGRDNSLTQRARQELTRVPCTNTCA